MAEVCQFSWPSSDTESWQNWCQEHPHGNFCYKLLWLVMSRLNYARWSLVIPNECVLLTFHTYFAKTHQRINTIDKKFPSSTHISFFWEGKLLDEVSASLSTCYEMRLVSILRLPLQWDIFMAQPGPQSSSRTFFKPLLFEKLLRIVMGNNELVFHLILTYQEIYIEWFPQTPVQGSQQGSHPAAVYCRGEP